MFPYDQDQTNQALQTLGSSYQLPSQQPAPAPAAQAAPPPAAAPAPAPTAETPDIQKPDGGGVAGTMGEVQGATSAIGGLTDDPEKKNAMDKLGGLIGGVISAYTGNAAGVAGGVSAMKG